MIVARVGRRRALIPVMGGLACLVVLWAARGLGGVAIERTTRGSDVGAGDNTGSNRDDEGGGDDELRLIVEVAPPGDKLAWRADVLRHAGPGDVIEKDEPAWFYDGVGDADLSIRLRGGRYLVRIRPEASWKALHQHVEVRSGEPAVVRFVLFVPGEIRGTVRDLHGNFVPGATVMLFPGVVRPDQRREYEPEQTVRHRRVEQDGTFRLKDCDPRAKYRIACAAPGFVPERHHDIRVRPRSVTQCDFVLTIAGGIVGRLADAPDVKTSNLTLTASHLAETSESLVRWEVEATATTGEDGSFEFECLKRGRKRVLATPQYRKGVTTVGCWFVDVEPGRTSDLGELHVLPSSIRLRITREDGSIPSSTRIRALFVPLLGTGSASLDAFMLYVFTNEVGVATIRGLPAGRLDLMIVDTSASGSGGAPKPLRKSFAFSGGIARFHITMPPEDGSAGRDEPVLRIHHPRLASGGFALIYRGERILGSVIGESSAGTIRSPVGMPDDENATHAVGLVVTDGNYGRQTLVSGGSGAIPVDLTPQAPGRKVEILVANQGHPLANRAVFLSLSDRMRADCVPIGFTNGNGRLCLNGCPGDMRVWVRTPGLDSKLSKPVPVEWSRSGTTRVVVDIGDSQD